MTHEEVADRFYEQPNILVRVGKLAACAALVGAMAAGSVVYATRRMAGALDQEKLSKAVAIPPSEQIFRPDDIDRLLESSMCDPSKCAPVAVDVAHKARIDMVRNGNGAGLSMDAVTENITDPVVLRINSEFYFVGHDGLAADRGLHKWRWDPSTMRICASDAAQNPSLKKVVLGRDVNSGGFKNGAAWFRSRPVSDDACHQVLLPEDLGSKETPFIRTPVTTTTLLQPLQHTRRLRQDGTPSSTINLPLVSTSTTGARRQSAPVVTANPGPTTTSSIAPRRRS